MDVVLDGETVTINVKDRLPDRQWDGGTLTINLKKHIMKVQGTCLLLYILSLRK